MEKYPRGRRGSPAKGVGWITAARVRIPPSPPVSISTKERNMTMLDDFICDIQCEDFYNEDDSLFIDFFENS